MKYCSHETHPPHRNAATRTSDSSELAMALSTASHYYPMLVGALFALRNPLAADVPNRRSTAGYPYIGWTVTTT